MATRARSLVARFPFDSELLFLAATALHRNLTVVSRNASDFATAQVQVLNPWEA
jgi:predicted nucleic acid-binding protein